MTSAFSWQNSISLCPASFHIPRPVNPGVSNYILISRTCEYVILLGKMDFEGVIKLQHEMGDYSELTVWTQCNHKGPYQREAGGQSEEGVVTKTGVVVRERDLEVLHCGHEERGRGHKPRGFLEAAAS